MKQASSLPGEYTFNDRNATILSFVRSQVEDVSPPIKQACVDHARFWNVLGECEEIGQKLASYQPPKLTDADFALVVPEHGVRKFAAHDGQSAFQAAVDFAEQRHRYPLAWRKHAACRILTVAEETDTALPDYANHALHKSAGLSFPTPETVETALVQRMNHTPEEFRPLQEKLGCLLSHLVENESLRRDFDFVKHAVEAVEQYDIETGLSEKYGESIDLPEDLLSDRLTFDKVAKLAGVSKLAVTLVNGQTVDVCELEKSALAAVDPKLASMDPGQLAAVLPTLPQADADLLTRVLA